MPARNRSVGVAIGLAIMVAVLLAAAAQVWLAPAIVLGAAAGFALQRGRFCGASLLGSFVLERDRTPLIGIGFAIAIAMIGLGALDWLGLVPVKEPLTVSIGGAIAGGVLFGVGMVFAGGCISGSLFKAAEGRLTSILAVVGILLGTSSRFGLLRRDGPITRTLDQWLPPLSTNRINEALHLSYGAIALGAGVVLAVALAFLWRRQAKPRVRVPFKDRLTIAGWSFPVTGIVIGILVTTAAVVSLPHGQQRLLPMTVGVATLVGVVVGGDAVSWWAACFVIGLLLGSAASAWLRRDLAIRSADPATLLVALGGGFLAGSGATIAKGCFLGGTVTGLALLSVSALVFSVVMVAANWITTFLYIRGLS